MTNEERTKILTQAIQTYGFSAQTDMCIEEMAELQQALLKYHSRTGAKGNQGVEPPRRPESTRLHVFLSDLRAEVEGGSAE